MVYTHTHKHTMEYYSHRKENEISPFAATWLNLKGLMPSEISQRKTIIVWYHLYMQFFKCNKQVSMLTKKKKKNRLTDTENKPVVTSGREGQHRGGGDTNYWV